MHEQALRDWIQLTATPGLGNTSVRRLLAQFGLPAQILAQPASALQSCISANQTKALLQPSDTVRSLQTASCAWLLAAPSSSLRRHIITLGDPDYPGRLLETADPPVLLYVLGHEQWFGADGLLKAWPDKSLAVVGSRNPTAQGSANAHAFSQALASQGVSIVSGLALGIDTAAHQGALAAPPLETPATIAVIGTGIDRVYPKHNHALAQLIAEHGLIVSEYHLGTPPLAQNFPKRNRIISGLALGTLVVEAAPESGSLVTARLANEQGREVFAIPGSIHSPQSKGCHALIRQGAKLVETVADILDELPLLSNTKFGNLPPTAADGVAGAPSSQPPANPLLAALGYDPTDLDTLSARTGWDAATLQIQLLELELQGQVARLPGGLYQRQISG